MESVWDVVKIIKCQNGILENVIKDCFLIVILGIMFIILIAKESSVGLLIERIFQVVLSFKNGTSIYIFYSATNDCCGL